jgi:hypothetical protein
MTWTDRLARWGTKPAADVEGATARLLDEARAASKLRGYRRDPDVAALTVEHTRERVERVLLVAMTCGLLYTTVNVQAFVAGGAEKWTTTWVAAWLVEPFITAGVLSLLRIEQVAGRHQVPIGGWVRFTRWAAFAATYLFNTWEAWFGPVFVPRDIVLHSIIPVLVFFFAEALTDGRDALTRAAEVVAVRKGIETPSQNPVDEPEEPDSGADTDELPIGPQPGQKGYLLHVAIPAAYRELALSARTEGRSLDTITLAEVDQRAGTNKYATRAMITPIRERIEHEWAVRDGAVA